MGARAHVQTLPGFGNFKTRNFRHTKFKKIKNKQINKVFETRDEFSLIGLKAQ
jgi:hypothetical protein